MATKKVFVAGFGGQGVLLIGQMLAYAAMYEGKEATWMPSYGPEMRGGTANCTVCISDKPIASPLVTTCDVLVAMNGPSLDKFEDMLVPGGHLFVNASVINYKARRTDVHVHYVDCTHIAEQEVGNGKTANMVMLGAYVGYTQVVPEDVVWNTIEHKLGKKPALLPLNRQAFEAGLQIGREAR